MSLATLLAGSSAFGATKGATVDDEGVSVVIVQTGAAPSAAGQVSGVKLDVEVTDDEVAALHGYRSLKSVVDVDCPGERDLVREATAFALPRLSGASQMRVTSGQWVRPTPEAYMSRVIKTICARVGLRPAGETVTAAASPAAAPASSTEKAGTPQRLQPTPALPAAPQAAPKPQAPNPAPPKTVGPASGAMAFVAAPRLRVQIASLPSPSAAQAVLDAARDEIQPPLAGEIEAAVVHGRKTYRSIIDNFSSEAAANAFCVRIKQARNAGCIVWKG